MYVLTNKTGALLLRPRENDENDENGGCHAGNALNIVTFVRDFFRNFSVCFLQGEFGTETMNN